MDRPLLQTAIHRVFELEEIAVAHAMMEKNAAVGKWWCAFATNEQ